MTEIKNKKSGYQYDEAIDPLIVFGTAPTKVSAPILRVVENDKVLGEILSNVWVNQPETRAHFVGGALFVTTCGYSLLQMRDVVKMRYAANTPIKLTWSPKRWVQEHEIGQRRATSERLTDANVTYENNQLVSLLTDYGKACIVKTSHELGLHAIEMLHCVASYHDSIVRSAGLVLRIPHEGNLYTGWVFCSTYEGKEILYLSQLKGIRNENPSIKVREEICELIGAVNYINEYSSRSSGKSTIPKYLADSGFHEQLNRSLQTHEQYKDNTISTIRWEYRGGGDSGDLDTIELVLDDGTALSATSWQSQQRRESGAEPAFELFVEHKEGSRPVLIFGWDIWSDTCEMHELSSWDWWNNDGGGVDIELKVSTLELDVSGYYNFTDSESCSGPLLDLTEELEDE